MLWKVESKKDVSERLCVVRKRCIGFEQQKQYLKNIKWSYKVGQKGQQK